jgi:hypothetical protein
MTDAAPPMAFPSPRRIAIGTAVAAVVGTVTAVFFVLPAEFGIDPTGFGEATGLTGLAGDASGMNVYLQRGTRRTNVLFPLDPAAKPDEATLRSTVSVPAGFQAKSDHWEYELLPYESIEMKYRMAQGQPMIFAWKASAPVQYDEHSVPDQGGNDATESFVITNGAAQTAVYVAPFTGIHGWFWQNQSLEPVTVTIDSLGGYTGAVIFNQSGEHPRELAPLQP